MSKPRQFAAVLLATSTAVMVFAESRCPGNVESLPYHSLNRHQIVVPVTINHSGPYNFLLDTGTQLTVIDPALAAELHLAAGGEASVRSAGVRGSATLTALDLIEAGTRQVAGLKVVVFDLAIQQGQTRDVRGILGEDFLAQFDLLIDNAHSMVCLDNSGAMRQEMKGRRVELLASPGGRKRERPTRRSSLFGFLTASGQFFWNSTPELTCASCSTVRSWNGEY